MEIPVGYCNITAVFGGENLPRGAACSIGCEADGVQDAGVIATVAAPAFADLHEGLSTGDVTLLSILVKLGPTDTGPFVEQPINVVGDQGTTTLPSQVSLNVRKRTPLGGVRFRGRMFWPGIPEAAFIDDGTIDPAVMSQYNATLEDFWDVFDVAGYPLVLLHSDGGTSPTPITRLECGVRSITQRRRNRRPLA